MSLAGFNPMDVEPTPDRTLLPDGEYEVMIAETQWKDTSTGGRMLAVTLQVIAGPFENRRVWHNLNLENQNQTAVDIAMRDLSSICRAVGHTSPLTSEDGSELCNRPMRVRIGTQPAKNGYEPSNKVKAWLPKDAASSAAPAASAASAPAKGKTPPWRR